MLYLGIDQHRKQLTVNLRDEAGETVQRRQVSTEWDRVRTFLAGVRAGHFRGRVASASGGACQSLSEPAR